MASKSFDKRYYERFYSDPNTRVTSQQDVDKLVRFVCAYLAHVGQPIKRVLDLGCGMGFWKNALGEQLPVAAYTGVEYSTYLCERFGWQQGSVDSYRARAPFDLVVCQGVLQYLPDKAAARALDNLGQLCRGALYLETLTQEDWDENCDRQRTDGDVHLRAGAWYRRRLAKRFANIGGGLFLHEDSPTQLFELERL